MAVAAHRALLGERIARHGLGNRDGRSVRAATALTTAVQAQDAPASRLGLRVRAAELTEADVVHAIEIERSVVRTWLMRGTIHLVAADDVRWMVRLIGPALVRKFRLRWQQLGLTDDVLEQSVAALPEVLADGPLDRRQIRAALDERGITLTSPDPQAHTHALVYASAIGQICRGPDRGRHATFALLDDWLPDAPSGPEGDDALAELARRYFAAYSPATAADFGVWSRLAAARAVALIRDELTPADVDGRPGFRLGEAEPQRGVRLLPAFDNYVIGYQDRSAIVAPELQPEVYQGGMIRPTILIDGQVHGTWSLQRAKRPKRAKRPERPERPERSERPERPERPEGIVTLAPFAELTAAQRRAVHAEAEDIGRFLGREIAVEGL